MYQSRSLHASRQIRLSCVRFVAKLARDTDPIRKVLVQQQLTASTPPPASQRLFKRAQQDFARVMASPGGNPFLLLNNTPIKGQASLTKHRLQSLVSRVKWNLQQEQTMALQADLALQTVDGIKGRKSTFLFASQLTPNWPGHELSRASPMPLRKAERPKTCLHTIGSMLTAFATVTWPPQSTLAITFVERMLSIKRQLPHEELEEPELPWPVLSAPLWTLSLGLWCLALLETTAG